MSLADLREQHLIRKQERHQNSDYYRIKTQYVHIAVIKLSSFKSKKVKCAAYSEELNIFKGKVIKRIKESKKQHTSLYEDYKYCYKIAMQNTVVDYLIKYCDENKVNFWGYDWVEVKFKFYRATGKYFCRVDHVVELTQEEATQRIDMMDEV